MEPELNNDTCMAADATVKEISLMEMSLKLWAKRKLLAWFCAVGFIVSLVVAFSIPTEYTTSVVFAPEQAGANGSGNMESLAAMAGIRLSSSSGDALVPDLYPNILRSTPFLIELSHREVVTRSGNRVLLQDYIVDELRSPWWNRVLGVFSALRNKAFGSKGIDTGGESNQKMTVLTLSRKQKEMLTAISERIRCSTDKKTGSVICFSTMQDPLVSAMVAEYATEMLKGHVVDYRTSKARQELSFVEQLFEESRNDYYKAQQKYAAYADRNQNVILQSKRTEMERLQYEMNLAFGIYNQSAQQLALARAKVSEITPVFTIIEPPIVPVLPSAPRKVVIVIGFLFLSVLLAILWVLWGQDIIKSLRYQINN